MNTLEYYKKKESVNFDKNENVFYSFSSPKSHKPKIVNKEWGEWPKINEYSKINSLIFSVFSSDRSKIKEYPDFLSKLTSLKHLSLPIDMFFQYVNELPSSLISLNLLPPLSFEGLSYEWPSKKFDSLLYLSIPELIKPFKLIPKCLPELNWLEYDMRADKKGIIFKVITNFEKLENLIISNVNNVDVFTPLKDINLKTISLFACNGKSFPIENISILKNLEFIGINNLGVDLDVSIFKHFKTLHELDFKNIKKSQNAKNITDIKSLKGLSINNCPSFFETLSVKELQMMNLDYLQINSDILKGNVSDG